MKFGSDCSGDCSDCVVHFTGGCLAGHGDDHFTEITESKARQLLQRDKQYMSQYLINELIKKFPNLKKTK